MKEIKKIGAVQFYLEIMKESNCTFKEAVETVLDLQSKKLIEIISYDNFGNPSVFYRIDKIPKIKDDWEHIEDIESEINYHISKIK